MATELRFRDDVYLRIASARVVAVNERGIYYASAYLALELGDPRYAAPAIVNRLMEAGRAGLKSGEGFYDYRGRDVMAYRKDVMSRMLAMLRQLGMARAAAE